MSKPHPIAVEAAEKIFAIHGGALQGYSQDITAIIQSAIEEATEPLFKILQWSYDEHMHFGWGYEELHDKIIEALGNKLKPQAEVTDPFYEPDRPKAEFRVATAGER